MSQRRASLGCCSLVRCPSNTADQLRSSVACAGFVSCIRLFYGTVPPETAW